MITSSPTEFLQSFADLTPLPDASATARAAFLVTPLGFSLAEQSARDNVYMKTSVRPRPGLALAQHAELAHCLREDCPVITFPGDAETPDAVFPNNVFATMPGHFVVGSMHHPLRRHEATRRDIRAFFRDVLGYREHDLSRQPDVVAELTGSLVIDHARGVGYCGLSERCNMHGVRAMHDAFGLRLTFCFELAAEEYHTNVVLSVLAGRAVILAPDGFRSETVPRAIATAYGNRAVMLEPQQKRAYAANTITLRDERVWMSSRAAMSLHDEQCQALGDYGFAIGSVDLSEIEKAGGSLRCCVGEIF